MKTSLPVRIIATTLSLIFVIIVVFPFYWQIITSVKTPAGLNLIPTELWPSEFGLQFYYNVFTLHDFHVYLFNSIIVASCTMVLSLCVALPAAYAFTRVRFKFRKTWKNFMLMANMFPIIAVVTPLFVAFKAMGLINTHLGLIIPSIVITLPLSIWTMVAFMQQIPYDLEQAAQIDGANRFQAVIRVVMPLMAPGLFSTAIIAFITAWNELMFALVFVTRNEYRTVPVGISLFAGEYTVPWGDMAAASIVATLPIVIVVMICQKQIVAGLTAGAVKG